MEHDGFTEQLDVPRCGWCDKPLTGIRRGSSYCSRAHKNSARRARKRSREQVDTLRSRYPLADASLTELDDRAREHQAASHPGEVPADHGNSYSVNDDGSQADEQTVRVRALLREDAARRVPRQPWAALKRAYSRNPGVELTDITQERAEQHQAQQRAVKGRLRSSTMQPQDRFNDVTNDAVATRANTSRRLNKVRVTSDPLPASQRQSFTFVAGQATWDAYRGGRARGQRARHADYAWQMDDGFRY
jgi:hypothetical protein